jgi:hypothetical protein
LTIFFEALLVYNGEALKNSLRMQAIFRKPVAQAEPPRASVQSTAHMAQALQTIVGRTLTGGKSAPLEVVLVSSGAHAHRGVPHRLVSSMRTRSAEGLSQLALLRVASAEYPAIRWGNLDCSLLEPSARAYRSRSTLPPGDVYGCTVKVGTLLERVMASL